MYLFMKYNTDQKNKPPKTSQCSLMIINEVHLFFFNDQLPVYP